MTAWPQELVPRTIVNLPRTYPIEYGTFKPPLEKWVATSFFGTRPDVFGGEDADFHKGTDLVSTKANAKILASADGVVISHYLPPGTPGANGKIYTGHPTYGALIIIAHVGGVYTLYGHMSKTFVREGQTVKQGDAIGIIGSTGKSSGTHLHFEILFDPMRFCFN